MRREWREVRGEWREMRLRSRKVIKDMTGWDGRGGVGGEERGWVNEGEGG